MEINMHAVFDELVINKEDEEETPQNNTQELSLQTPLKSWKTVTDHPPEQIIGDTSDGIRTRRFFINNDGNMTMISHIEPKNIQQAICEESWVIAVKEELSQFKKNEVWNFVPKPQNQSIIGTR